MRIQIAGPGCAKCHATERLVRDVCAGLGVEAEIEHVTDTRTYTRMGVLLTPAVVVDGRVVLSGRVPGREELADKIRAAAR